MTEDSLLAAYVANPNNFIKTKDGLIRSKDDTTAASPFAPPKKVFTKGQVGQAIANLRRAKRAGKKLEKKLKAKKNKYKTYDQVEEINSSDGNIVGD